MRKSTPISKTFKIGVGGITFEYSKRLSNCHHHIKKWMNRVNGVATKYINNYIKWFKWLQIFDTDKEMIKAKTL
jgi:hypothetical protein